MKLTFEQIQQAKKVSIVDVLQWYGFSPLKRGAKWLTYPNPFRSEKTPSFMVCPATNTFRDFGTAESGDVIDLIKKFENCGFAEAVRKLTETNQNFSFNGKKNLSETEISVVSEYYIQAVKPLTNKFFLQYIESRKLNPVFAKLYLKEIYYKRKSEQSKNYFGIGIENQSKGFEVKNISKGCYYCLGSKNFTTIEQANEKHWLVFEGMFDFLALLTYLKKLVNANIILLHSVSMIPKAIDFLKVFEPAGLYLFLDNDKAGNEGTNKFLTAFPFAKDFRKMYLPYKDLNEMLIKETLSSDLSFQSKNAVSMQ